LLEKYIFQWKKIGKGQSTLSTIAALGTTMSSSS